MRDYRDAKAMAHSLREALSNKQISISHSESLELVSRTLGIADWNTLSALLNNDRREPVATNPPETGLTLPAIPLRGIVAFPAMQLPLFVGRQKTIRALTQAFVSRRELVLIAQKQESTDEPGPDDVYDVGVVARMIDIGPLSPELLARRPEMEKVEGIKVLVQTERRVRVQGFSVEGGWHQAEIDEIDEGGIVNAPDLIEKAASQFDRYSAAHSFAGPEIIPPLGRLHDPGRVADVIAVRVVAPIREKQAILATLDPIERLQRVMNHMEA